MIGVFLTNIGNILSEFAGVAAGMEVFGVDKFISVPLSAFLVWWMVVKGSYKSVEKAFLVACVFYASYVITVLLLSRIGDRSLISSQNPGLALSRRNDHAHRFGRNDHCSVDAILSSSLDC